MIRPGALRGGVAVVLDVLRASTVMVQALGSGAKAIVPCLEIEDAQAVARSLPAGTAILAGERFGLPIAGFDFGNSPRSFTPEVCAGKTIVMTTTNGTSAIHAALDADEVLIGAFANLSATIRRLRDDPRPVHLVASGTNGSISFEDVLLAGAIALGLAASRPSTGNDEAVLASAAWRSTQGEYLSDVLRQGIGGRRVVEIGLEADIETAAKVDRFDLVAEVVREPLRIVRAH